jgi:hypothetical protein
MAFALVGLGVAARRPLARLAPVGVAHEAD